MKQDLTLLNKLWWSYIDEDIQELLQESTVLLQQASSWKEFFHDYSFIVFPAAKAYEGFLKKLFLELDFITEQQYLGKSFRIGKALNPALEEMYRRDESIYDKLIEKTKDKELADQLWETWKSCRNVLFHWFPNEKNFITYAEAKSRVEQVILAIDTAYQVCMQ